jgi:hypothetical protein
MNKRRVQFEPLIKALAGKRQTKKVKKGEKNES